MVPLSILMIGVGGWLMYEEIKGNSPISALTSKVQTTAGLTPSNSTASTVTAPAGTVTLDSDVNTLDGSDSLTTLLPLGTNGSLPDDQQSQAT